MYPYPWGQPPQYQQLPPPTDDQYQRAIRLLQKIQLRDEREKERKKLNERKHREDDRKQAAARVARFWLGVELFIFGILAQPFVMYGYTHMLKAVTP